ncbi:MAG: alpha-1,2-fucosyltransferase, partial [Bacteroidota bacterium]
RQALVELAGQIKMLNSICLNVRRTDFITDKTLNVTSVNYFKKAADYIAGQVEEPCFFIFSDDIDWCRKNLDLPYLVNIVGHEHKGKKFGNYLQLMSLCKHFIIPNSSFAWWAAWLSQQSENKIVVTPDPWFAAGDYNTKDLIPDDWIRFSTNNQ